MSSPFKVSMVLHMLRLYCGAAHRCVDGSSSCGLHRFLLAETSEVIVCVSIALREPEIRKWSQLCHGPRLKSWFHLLVVLRDIYWTFLSP